MGIYIRGMEMPECCGYCPFEYKNYCMAKPSLRVEYADRHPRCPLIPVPPHGRLIDADALKWNYIRIRDDGIKEFSQYGIDRAPTVIEADYPPSVPLEQVWTELFGEGESDVRRPD